MVMRKSLLTSFFLPPHLVEEMAIVPNTKRPLRASNRERQVQSPQDGEVTLSDPRYTHPDMGPRFSDFDHESLKVNVPLG